MTALQEQLLPISMGQGDIRKVPLDGSLRPRHADIDDVSESLSRGRILVGLPPRHMLNA